MPHYSTAEEFRTRGLRFVRRIHRVAFCDRVKPTRRMLANIKRVHDQVVAIENGNRRHIRLAEQLLLIIANHNQDIRICRPYVV